MPFAQFQSPEQLLEKYPLQRRVRPILPDQRVPIPSWLQENIDFALSRRLPGDGESYATENFVYPLLQLAWKRHPRLHIWVRRHLEADQLLSGEPDYLLAESPTGQVRTLVQAPLLAVIEAKRENFDEGWGQCLAAMLVCQTLNQNQPALVYGIVTTGLQWEFGTLSGITFTRDTVGLSLRDRAALFGAVDFRFAECERQLPATPTGVATN